MRNLLTVLMLLLATNGWCRTVVAIVDTGLDLSDPRFSNALCPNGHKDFTDAGIKDTNGHGTHIAGLIKSYAKKSDYCMLIYKYYEPNKNNVLAQLNSFKEAIKNGANIINFSGGGSGYLKEEYEIIKSHPEVLFIVAAGNEGKNLSNHEYTYYPASYNLSNMIIVSSYSLSKERDVSSNYGSFVSWEVGVNQLSTLPDGKTGYMSGTSQATAIKTGKIISEKK